MNILTEYYEWFVLQIEPGPITHKDREESRKATSTLSNFMYQFRYKRNGFAKYPKIDSGTPEIRGTQFEQHNKTIALDINLLLWHDTSTSYYNADKIHVWRFTLTLEVTRFFQMSIHIYHTTRRHIKVYVIFSQSW